MHFNFQQTLERRFTASLKWQRYEHQDIIPMWVADMDLASPPQVQNALRQAVDLGVFGYGEVPAQLNATFLQWCQTNYNWQPEAEWLVWLPGVVPGFNLAVEAWLNQDEGLLTQTPIYPPIKNLASLRQRPNQVIAAELGFQANQPLDPKVRALVLCNPHNPLGKVYSQAELEEVTLLAEQNNLIVISDEIWADLILDTNQKHQVYASLSPTAAQHSITLMAPSKTFNIAGLSCAVGIIPNPELRAKFKAAMRGLMPDMNYLGLHAAQAAWHDGHAWLTALKQHLNSNLDVLEQWLTQFPQIGYQRPQATFVAWLDVSALQLEDPEQFFLQAGVALTPGLVYGAKQHVRLNFGCPEAQLQEALARMAKAILEMEH